MELFVGLFVYAVVALLVVRFFAHVQKCDEHVRRLFCDQAPRAESAQSEFAS